MLYALPFDRAATASVARGPYPPASPRKRKRPSSVDSTSDGGDEADQTATQSEAEPAHPAPAAAALLAGLTNPLSLTPDEVRQYRAAGLSLDQPWPATAVPGFPHRPLPAWFHGCDGDEDGADGARARKKAAAAKARHGSNLRVHHLGVLTTLLHRCLASGDIPRAARAWSMLLRSELGGRAMDLRSAGYWGIGAELLVRGSGGGDHAESESDDDVPQSSQLTVTTSEDHHTESHDQLHPRWGTRAGLQLAKEYFERLILQHPYRQRWEASVNALDFWPSMLACEIYGVQHEHEAALLKLTTHAAALSDDEPDDDSDYDDDAANDDYAALERRATMRRERRNERVFARQETARQAALHAAEGIAVRMDELMVKPPYSDSHVLLRLRGMLALYVGDLSVPARGSDADDEDEPVDENLMSDDMQFRDSSRRFVVLQRRAEYHRGQEKQHAQRALAMEKFRKIYDAGAVDDELEALYPDIRNDKRDAYD